MNFFVQIAILHLNIEIINLWKFMHSFSLPDSIGTWLATVCNLIIVPRVNSFVYDKL